MTESGAMFLARGRNSDFHVLTQSREEFHQSANGKVTGAIPHQQGDLRLLHARILAISAWSFRCSEDGVNLQGELRL